MKKILTLILSGIGETDKTEGNAVLAANMETYKKFYEENPHTSLYAAEENIGLEPGQISDGQLSHIAMGSGRVRKSSFEQVNELFDNYSENETLNELLEQNNRTVHLIGMCSDGNIHSSVEHFLKMHELLVNHNFKKIYFHLITDGRDTSNTNAYAYIEQIEKQIKKLGVGIIGTLCGRSYAMDRDMHYEYTKVYYDLITRGKGLEILNIKSSLAACYEKKITDEIIRPLIVDNKSTIKNNDIVIWMNYRSERSKQLLNAFLNPKFAEFNTKEYTNLDIYTFFPIDKTIKSKVIIDNSIIDNPLGLYFSKLGIKQARVAEIEKFQHVTTFFDGNYTGKIDNCDRFLIPSNENNNLITHPEMNAAGVSKKVMDCMEKDYTFILANLANIDMCAHTGDFRATVNSCKVIDICLDRILKSAEDNFYTVIILSDQGNAEEMVDDKGNPNYTHTINKVPFIIGDKKVSLKKDGNLTNFAPTLLDYMDISVPLQMTSESLLEKGKN